MDVWAGGEMSAESLDGIFRRGTLHRHDVRRLWVLEGRVAIQFATGAFRSSFPPMWSIALAVFGGFLAFYFRFLRFQFGIRSLIIATALCAALIRLLTLRAT